MKKRLLTICCAAVLGVSLLAGCGSPEPERKEGEEGAWEAGISDGTKDSVIVVMGPHLGAGSRL